MNPDDLPAPLQVGDIRKDKISSEEYLISFCRRGFLRSHPNLLTPVRMSPLGCYLDIAMPVSDRSFIEARLNKEKTFDLRCAG